MNLPKIRNAEALVYQELENRDVVIGEPPSSDYRTASRHTGSRNGINGVSEGRGGGAASGRGSNYGTDHPANSAR